MSIPLLPTGHPMRQASPRPRCPDRPGRLRPAGALAAALVAALVGTAMAAPPLERVIPRAELRSGIEFAGRDVRALHDDPAGNPAQLWIDQGRQLWARPAQAPGSKTPGPACRDCHGEPASMRGVSVAYPKVHPLTGQLFNLEDQIRHCSVQQQGLPAPAHESDELLGLALLITQASRGLPLRVNVTPALEPHLRAGEAIFQRRQGQLNLACGHCHDRHWGQRLHTDPLSQGHPNSHPVYRLEWQKPGSLERRLRSCFFGVRAEIPPWGILGMRQLSLYLAWRAEGLPVEVPAVRK